MRPRKPPGTPIRQSPGAGNVPPQKPRSLIERIERRYSADNYLDKKPNRFRTRPRRK